MTDNSLIFLVLKAGKNHFVRRRLEDSHLARSWTMFFSGDMYGVNLRRRHQRQGSLLVSTVPRPT